MLDLPAITIGAPLRQGPLTVVPLYTSPARAALPYALGDDAFARGVLEVREVDGGAVDRLDAYNRGADRVFLLEGDHLIGAKQNRAITSSAMIGVRRRVILPAACVERGRWQGTSMRFRASATVASASVRRIIKHSVTAAMIERGRRDADQSKIWATIGHEQNRLGVMSPTAALSQTYAARGSDVAAIASELPYPPGATGVAIGIGDELVSLDVFDRAPTCAHYWRRLVDAAALDALDRPVTRTVADADIRDLIRRLEAGSWSRFPSVGDGHELRVSAPGLTAATLVVDGVMVHLGVALGAAVVPLPPRTPRTPRPMLRDDELPQTLASRYAVTRAIGHGGAKAVFRASARGGGADVAIARVAADPEVFAREVALLRRVESDHVPRVLEAVFAEDHGYLVMEFCDGPNLAQLAAERGALPIAEAAPILVAFARALRDIHAAAILHRDIKLENAVLCATERGTMLKLLDFGLSLGARDDKTDVGSRPVRWAGTLPHMAREALRGSTVDARTDVFAFGVCCYRLLVGKVPVPPVPHESTFDYVRRLAAVERIDVTRLPALPRAVADMVARMLDTERTRRPFMPEVVEAFEAGFGIAPLPASPPARYRARRLELQEVARYPLAVERPERVMVAPCDRAPIVALEPSGSATMVHGIDGRGELAWSRRIDGHVTVGVRADLDHDGVREIYLAGMECLAALSATGELRYLRRITGAYSPTLIAIRDPAEPRIVIDGMAFEPQRGDPRGPLPFVFAGDGRQLVAVNDRHGVAYNGFALQGFRGENGTAAAIIVFPFAQRFAVAHLEEARPGRVQLVVYGPGGARLHGFSIADADVTTGDPEEIASVISRPLFGPDDAPIAMLGNAGKSVLIAPLVGADRAVPAGLAAFELPTGRELWRHRLDAPQARAMFGDVDGDGKAELIVGTERELMAFDPWTGEQSLPLPAQGLPVAYGDPFGTGFAHLVTASNAGIRIWRGPRCEVGRMQWSGARGDLWRTGTLRVDGTPVGPV